MRHTENRNNNEREGTNGKLGDRLKVSGASGMRTRTYGSALPQFYTIPSRARQGDHAEAAGMVVHCNGKWLTLIHNAELAAAQ